MANVSPLLLALALAVGCGGMAIDGVVVDHAGNPVPDAMVTAVGTPHMATTDATGAFSLSCPPGVYDLTIAQVGHVTIKMWEYDANERQRYDLGRQVLVKVPEEKGLLLFTGGGFETLERGYVTRKSGGFGKDQYRHYCVDAADSAVNALSAGGHTFFDHESVGWRAFQLDENGCAYKMSPNGPTSWGIDYNTKAKVESEQLEQGLERVLVTFEAGEYFIAHWDQGFFTKASREDGRYTGFYVKVQ